MTFKAWPWQYDFPPFFTLQPNFVTREKQLEAWSQLVTDYAQFKKIHTIDINEVSNSELFNNSKLNRSLNPEGVRAVFEYLEQKKNIEWLDPTKSRCHIYWRRPEEWGSLIYEWALSSGLLNTPCTLYEIAYGDDTLEESFHNLEKDVLLKALRFLETQRKAQLINIGTENEGVKFLQCSMSNGTNGHRHIKTENSVESTTSMASIDPNAPSFFKNNDKMDEGDTVMIYVSYGSYIPIILKRGHTLAMKFGALRHEFVIGKPWGSRISATAGYIYALRPSAELWTRCLPRRTQILYTHDNALILLLLDAKPGSVICESGTGSGSLSHAIATTVAPTGHLYTHDIEETRTRSIEQEFQNHGLSDVTTAVVQNVCTDGFFVTNACDGVFLDVPAPWEAIKHAVKAISQTRGGRLVSFSPCIEQVQRACQKMREYGFVQIETIECVPKMLKVTEQRLLTLAEFDSCSEKEIESAATGGERAKKRKLDESVRQPGGITTLSAIPFPHSQPTHTGYLTHATMLPRK